LGTALQIAGTEPATGYQTAIAPPVREDIGVHVTPPRQMSFSVSKSGGNDLITPFHNI
jgi:uncharacterized protein (DUF2237 family)